MIYSSCRLKLVFIGHVLPFYTPLKPKKSEFWKNEKKLLEISSFYTCVPKSTIVWGTVPEIQSDTDRIFWHFGSLFPFYPLTTQKIKTLKKCKKCPEMSSFYSYVPKITIIWCMLSEIWSATDRIFCHFGLFFALSHL